VPREKDYKVKIPDSKPTSLKASTVGILKVLHLESRTSQSVLRSTQKDGQVPFLDGRDAKRA